MKGWGLIRTFPHYILWIPESLPLWTLQGLKCPLSARGTPCPSCRARLNGLPPSILPWQAQKKSKQSKLSHSTFSAFIFSSCLYSDFITISINSVPQPIIPHCTGWHWEIAISILPFTTHLVMVKAGLVPNPLNPYYHCFYWVILTSRITL